jgi:hypothetical protein
LQLLATPLPACPASLRAPICLRRRALAAHLLLHLRHLLLQRHLHLHLRHLRAKVAARAGA